MLPQRCDPHPPFIERLVELEWPDACAWVVGRLRLSLIPSKDGYVTRAEFEEHPVATKEAPVRHVPGYTLLGIARLDGVGFEIEPRGDQRRIIPPGEEVTWRWTLRAQQPGQQRLGQPALRWDNDRGNRPEARWLSSNGGCASVALGMTRSRRYPLA
jgi:hypothetical protein